MATSDGAAKPLHTRHPGKIALLYGKAQPINLRGQCSGDGLRRRNRAFSLHYWQSRNRNPDSWESIQWRWRTGKLGYFGGGEGGRWKTEKHFPHCRHNICCDCKSQSDGSKILSCLLSLRLFPTADKLPQL